MGNNRTGPITTCKKCGREFRAWRPDRPNQYCSRECAPTGRRSTRPLRECARCGLVFRAQLREGKRQRYCSRECYRASGIENRYVDPTSGYVRVWAPDEPGAYPNGQIIEHRLVMQRHLKRPLESHETVHHINGDRSDNRLENLQLRTGKHGKGVRHVCNCCGSTDIRSEHV